MRELPDILRRAMEESRQRAAEREAALRQNVAEARRALAEAQRLGAIFPSAENMAAQGAALRRYAEAIRAAEDAGYGDMPRPRPEPLSWEARGAA